MDEISIKRINELARKKKNVGLTPDEQNEQQELYKRYIAEMRSSLKSQLDNTDVQTPDGKVTPLSSFNKKQKK